MMLNKGLFLAFGLCVLCLVGCAPKGYVVGLTADTSLGYSWRAYGTQSIEGRKWEFASSSNTKVVDPNLCDGEMFQIRQKSKNSALYVDFGVPFKLAGRVVRLDSVRTSRLYIGDLGQYTDSSAVGSKLPYFEVTDPSTGKAVDLRALLKGKYALLNFWDPWCEVCMKYVPQINAVTKRIGSRDDVVVIGLVDVPKERLRLVSSGYNVNLSGALFRNCVTLRREVDQWPGASWVLSLFDYPTYVVVDKEGRIAYRSGGPNNSRERAIEFFEQLIK